MVCIVKLLKAFRNVFFDAKAQAPATNLLRKWFATEVAKSSNRDKAIAVVARIDAHSKGVADAVYDLSDPAEDAARAKHVVDVYLQGGAAWPSQETQSKLRSKVAEMVARMRLRTNVDETGGDDSIGSSDDDSESDKSDAVATPTVQRASSSCLDAGMSEVTPPKKKARLAQEAQADDLNRTVARNSQPSQNGTPQKEPSDASDGVATPTVQRASSSCLDSGMSEVTPPEKKTRLVHEAQVDEFSTTLARNNQPSQKGTPQKSSDGDKEYITQAAREVMGGESVPPRWWFRKQYEEAKARLDIKGVWSPEGQ